MFVGHHLNNQPAGKGGLAYLEKAGKTCRCLTKWVATSEKATCFVHFIGHSYLPHICSIVTHLKSEVSPQTKYIIFPTTEIDPMVVGALLAMPITVQKNYQGH